MSTTQVHDIDHKLWYLETKTLPELLDHVTHNALVTNPSLVVVFSVDGKLVEADVLGFATRSNALEKFVGDKLNDRSGDVQDDEIESLEHHQLTQMKQGEVLYVLAGSLRSEGEPSLYEL